MANYLTTDTELTSIADAIRAKTDISTPIVYPSGFVTAIENISTGNNIATAEVSIVYSDANATYYIDDTMTFHAITSGNQDLTNVSLPIDSIVVTVRTGMSEPQAGAMSVSGLTLVNSYTIDSRGVCRIYKVTG